MYIISTLLIQGTYTCLKNRFKYIKIININNFSYSKIYYLQENI